MNEHNQEKYDKNKGDAKLGFLWVALIAFTVAVGIAVVIGAIAGFSAVTAGPRDNLRGDFAYACNKQFQAAQFPQACVDFVMEDK